MTVWGKLSFVIRSLLNFSGTLTFEWLKLASWIRRNFYPNLDIAHTKNTDSNNLATLGKKNT